MHSIKKENQKLISENLLRGVSEGVLLAMLSQEDMYGHQLVQQVAERSEGRFSIQESSMYPILYRLEDKGLISSQQKLVGRRRMRTYYHLEAPGLEYLKDFFQVYDSVQKGIEMVFSTCRPYPKEE